MLEIKNKVYVDSSKYSIFDIIEFLKKEGYEVEWNIPGKLNEKCLQWWKEKHPEDLEEVLASDYECKNRKKISIRVLGTRITIYPLAYAFKLDTFLEGMIRTSMYDMYDRSKEEIEEEKKLLIKLRKEFGTEEFSKTYKIKDLEKLIKFVEENNLHIDQEGKVINSYKKLINMRDLTFIEKKEIEYLLKKGGMNLDKDYNREFNQEIHRKLTFFKGRTEPFSWTPTYPNWEEDIKKYPELDHRKNWKKKSFFKKLFSKD